MKTTCVLLLVLVGMAMVTVEAKPIDKRLLEGLLDSIKQIFNSLVANAKLTFTNAIDMLTKHITADETVAQCEATCKKSATAIFGSGAESVAAGCHPLCIGALMKLNDVISG